MKKIILLLIFIMLLSCSKEPISQEEYSESDNLIKLISSNVSDSSFLNKEIEVDHSRLANERGSNLSPAKVFMFSNKELNKKLIEKSRILALELPLRIQAYTSDNKTKVIWNSIDYISKRYDLIFSEDIRKEYKKSFSVAVDGIPNENISTFPNEDVEKAGIITLHSQFDYETSYEKLQKGLEIIKKIQITKDNKDVVVFGIIDYQSIINEMGGNINKATLVMFGAPKPGGKAMNGSETLGLDAFPQKVLIWEDEEKKVNISYNNLIDMADRQEVKKTLALRVIQYRMNKSFKKYFN